MYWREDCVFWAEGLKKKIIFYNFYEQYNVKFKKNQNIKKKKQERIRAMRVVRGRTKK